MSKHPQIVVKPNRGFEGTEVGFVATFGEYDLGDPVGIGATEDEARKDLMMEMETHEQA